MCKVARTILALFVVIQTALVASEANPGDFDDCCSSHMEMVIVEPQDLLFDQDDIFLNFDGTYYPVHALYRNGNQWLAGVIAAGERCPWGHPLCGHCKLCHTRICPVYIPRCSASK
jgi:hypothetical protein